MIHIQIEGSAAECRKAMLELLHGAGVGALTTSPPIGSINHARSVSEAQIKMAAEGMSTASDTSSDTPGVAKAEAFLAEQPTPEEPAAPAPKPRGRPKKEAAPIVPPAPEPETEAQDAADEAEESAGEVPADPETVEIFTRDTIRNELGNYSRVWGLENAYADGPVLIEAKNAASVEDTQEALGKAVLALRTAIVSNPFKREPASATA